MAVQLCQKKSNFGSNRYQKGLSENQKLDYLIKFQTWAENDMHVKFYLGDLVITTD